uniref:Galactolipase n=1 Tax=Opuntia streptacantha TaxID=393608 RepID=A0A7C9EK65_OPUST
MDSLLMRSGLHGLGSSITVSSGLDARPGPTQFSSIGRSSPPVTNAISVGKGGSAKISSFSFSSFNYPFRSLFLGGGNKQSPKGVALDDAGLLEKEEHNASTSLDESDGQNGNWVLKILHVNSLWLSEKQGKAGGEEGESEGQNGNCPPSSSSSSSCSDDNEEGGGCRVCDDDDERGKLEFDRDSFSKLLKKVSLAEARLYAQMSYLGSLAYEIPKIKVLLFLIQLLSQRFIVMSWEIWGKLLV